MFCGECGAKNKSDAAFCESCGAKLEKEENKTNKKEVKKEVKNTTKKEVVVKKVVKEKEPKEPMPKKKKALIVVAVIALVALFGGYKYLEKQYSAETIVNKYLEAVNNKNYKSLYKYSNYEGDKTFITEALFTKAMKEKESKSSTNYTLTNMTYEDNGQTAIATLKAVGGSNENKVKLTKLTTKKLVFFDDWTVSDASSFGIETVKDYTITVPKDTEVTYGGIKVDKKYISSDKSSTSSSYSDDSSSDSNLVNYKLPQVFATDTEMSFKLANGIEKTDETTPATSSSYYYSNSSYKLTLTEKDFSKDLKNKLLEATKKTTETVTNGLVKETEFDSLEGLSLDSATEKMYNNKLKSIKRGSTDYTSFTINEADIEDISLSSDGYINVEIYLKYAYKYKYTGSFYSDDEERDYDSSTYITFKVKFDKDNTVTYMSKTPFGY